MMRSPACLLLSSIPAKELPRNKRRSKRFSLYDLLTGYYVFFPNFYKLPSNSVGALTRVEAGPNEEESEQLEADDDNVDSLVTLDVDGLCG